MMVNQQFSQWFFLNSYVMLLQWTKFFEVFAKTTIRGNCEEWKSRVEEMENPEKSQWNHIQLVNSYPSKDIIS